MPAHLSIAQRAILHTLLDAIAPVPIATLIAAAGIKAKSASSTISNTRLKVEAVGARIVCHGVLAAARYELLASDFAPVLAMAGPKIERPSFMGFRDRYGAILRVIVEAAGRPVTLHEIADTVYRRAHGEQRIRAASMIGAIRKDLAARDASQTVLVVGPAASPSYVWGSAEKDIVAISLPAEGITLPSVGGTYRFAAGRLTLDGQIVGRGA